MPWSGLALQLLRDSPTGCQVQGKKTLVLLKKSNPPLLEWFQSPIVYSERREAVDKIKALIPRYFSPIACMYHYLRMAEGNYRKYLHRDEVLPKKYFYVLRPLLACRWIEQALGPVPMELTSLVSSTLEAGALTEEINALIESKRTGEVRDDERFPEIRKLFDTELGRLSMESLEAPENKGSEELDQCFRFVLDLVNG